MDRNRTLDGVRGSLALLVLLWHASSGSLTLDNAVFMAISQYAVLGFFILSGLVLTRAWDGDVPAFLLRRFVRLWPLYALSLAAGFLAAHRWPEWSQFLWYPLMNSRDNTLVDHQAWSLCIEAWAMPAMPLFVLAGRSLVSTIAGVGACFLLARWDSNFGFGVFFVLGAWLARFEIRARLFETAPLQWLGRISYPLYLTHWMVLHYLGGPLWARVALAFAIAQALTWTVERWSISGSRRAGRWVRGLRPTLAALNRPTLAAPFRELPLLRPKSLFHRGTG